MFNVSCRSAIFNTSGCEYWIRRFVSNIGRTRSSTIVRKNPISNVISRYFQYGIMWNQEPVLLGNGTWYHDIVVFVTF